MVWAKRWRKFEIKQCAAISSHNTVWGKTGGGNGGCCVLHRLMLIQQHMWRWCWTCAGFSIVTSEETRAEQMDDSLRVNFFHDYLIYVAAAVRWAADEVSDSMQGVCRRKALFAYIK